MKKYISSIICLFQYLSANFYSFLPRDLAYILLNIYLALDGDFPGGLDSKESACNEGGLALIPGLGRSPEKGMTAHFSVFAWRIPWIREPSRLQCMGSQKVGHN